MKLSVKGFIYHKTSEKYSDCFDRYAVNKQNNKFAVSDGVSKSFFSGIWAELLVNSFVNTQGKVNLTNTELLASIQNQWIEKVDKIVSRPNQKFFVRNLHAQKRSAAATFVGLHFFNSNSRIKWEAFAIGDSFMFFKPEEVKDITKDFKQMLFLSSKRDFEFDNFPDFIDSRSKINKGKIKQIEHDLKPGTFYIMTDALSQWFITEKQAAVDEIKSWTNQEVFEDRIQSLRKDSLQNDDVAILIIEVQGYDEKRIEYGDIAITDLNKFIDIEREQTAKEDEQWAPIEKELMQHYEHEKHYAERKLAEKHYEEWENYRRQLTEYFKRRQDEARKKLQRQQEEEWEQFDREWKRILENEKMDMEQQLSKKQESEKFELEQRLRNEFESAKEGRKRALQKGDFELRVKDTAPASIKKEEDQKKETKKESMDSAKDKRQDRIDDSKKKRGFWESTKEISSEAIDKVSNIFHKKEEDAESNEYPEKSDRENKKREFKITDREERERKRKDKEDDNDISSITDKF